MRLIHISDLHLGFRQFQRVTPSGINQREADVASVFRSLVDKIIALKPELVCIAGDVFHQVRPSNPAILHAFQQFARLVTALPGTDIVVIAGNHDLPRSAETGCILRLFRQLNVHVADVEPVRFAFPERNLAVLAVPDSAAGEAVLEPDPAFAHNVLVMHQLLEGILPSGSHDGDNAETPMRLDDVHAPRWNYVALGHYHVYRQVAPNAYYAGAIEYTSTNIWGELAEEKAAKLPGKGMIEFDLETGKRTFHPVRPARALVDLHVLSGRGLTASDLDAAIRENIERVPGGIDDKIVRQIVRDVPRHVTRELDHKALREYRRRALSFNLDARRPEIVRTSASGAPGRRASLADTVRDKLLSRQLSPGVNRDELVELGMRYLREAEQVDVLASSVAVETA